MRINILSIYLFFRDIKVGSKVLGKKYNDIWYKGTVMDVTESAEVAEVCITLHTHSFFSDNDNTKSLRHTTKTT